MLNNKFFKKIATPELKHISGRRYSNLMVLSLILILSMIAIGLGEGAISYLDKKMNNPFVSFVNVKIPMGNPFTIERMKGIHNKKNPNIDFYDYYGFKKSTNDIKRPYPVFDTYKNFTNQISEITSIARIRKGAKNDPVYDYILKTDKNALNNNFEYDGWGCVVSLDYLLNKNKLNYSDKNIPFISFNKEINEKIEFFSIPVQGVVKSFPDEIDILVGEKLFHALEGEEWDFWSSLVLLDSNRNNYLQYYVNRNDELEQYLIDNKFIEIDYDEILYDNGKMFKRDNLNSYQRDVILARLPDLVCKHIQKDKTEYSTQSHKILDFNLVNSPRNETNEGEFFVFEFLNDRFDGISNFNDFLKRETLHDQRTLSIDMRIIENKRNFDLFNKLALLLSFALIFFSIFSIVLYITNLIVSHLSKNKKNLGTLKAFGLSSNNIVMIYSTISIALISSAFVISYFISLFIGPLIVPIIADYFNISDSASLHYISYSFSKLVALFIALPSVFIYFKLRRELINSTPGDLIYGRD